MSDLYSFDKASVYMGTYGFSWRGFAAYIAGILINVVGFAGAVGADVPIGATYVYNLSYFTGFIVAMLVYYVLCKIWPPRLTKDEWSELSVEEVEEALGFSTGYEGQNPDDIIDDSIEKKDNISLKVYSA